LSKSLKRAAFLALVTPLLAGCPDTSQPTAIVVTVDVKAAVDCVFVSASNPSNGQERHQQIDLTVSPYKERDYRRLVDPATGKARTLDPLQVLLLPGEALSGDVKLSVVGRRGAGACSAATVAGLPDGTTSLHFDAKKVTKVPVTLKPLCANPKATCDADGDGYGDDDCDDANNRVFPGAEEICGDTFDNNCNGLTDEGCPCKKTDPPVVCYPLGLKAPQLHNTPCQTGTQKCDNLDAQGNGNWSLICDGAILPADEKCDGVDQDCDGIPDPLSCGCVQGRPCYTGPANTISADGNTATGSSCNPSNPKTKTVCHAGTWDCGTNPPKCIGQVVPADHESCNACDDDCNGAVDDKPVTAPCGQGVCAAVNKACVNGSEATCDTAKIPNYAPTDVCTAAVWVDNNCDGTVGGGCTCTPGQTQKCYPSNDGGCDSGGNCKGECKTGITTCVTDPSGGNAHFGPCVGSVGKAPEVCNAKDDDCNGNVDDNLTDVGGACNAPPPAAGQCVYGSWGCPSGATARVCLPAPPVAEKCDDQSGDWDCDSKPGCQDPDCNGKSCDDRDLCTFSDVCAGGSCTGTTLSCPSDVCATRACNGSSSCTVQLHDGTPCTDANACTSGDTCANTQCVGSQINCDDGNPCTIDSCDTGSGCQHVPGNAGAVCRPLAAGSNCDVVEVCDGASAACPADTFQASSTVCRPTAGPCDVTENCTGASAYCPTDTFVSGSTVCRPAADICDVAENCPGNGPACPADGFQSSATVCRAAAGGGCDVAESCPGNGPSCPADGFRPASFVCRASGGVCDVAENCPGNGPACPGDAFQPSSTVCRSSAGPCDVAENCTGGSATCPGDTFLPGSTVCRASAGVCDVAENCTGAAAACPTDSFVSSATVCRPAADVCDAAENCTGSGANCPADIKKSGATVCRASASACDQPENCDGVGNACPADIPWGGGHLCRASAGMCDVAESCDGVSFACPADAFVPNTTVCRPTAGICDVAENCTGAAAACPADTFLPGSTVCRASAGVCDVAENCPGNGANCPADAFALSSVVCRAATDVCDVAENCPGNNASCPADAVHLASFVCRAAVSVCDVAESCDGSTKACPTDAFATSAVVCRASAGTCDIAENCTGSSTTCPTDAFQGGGTSCRAAANDCDVEELCSGSAAACPTDTFQPINTVCNSGPGLGRCLGTAANCVKCVGGPEVICGDGLDNDCDGSVDCADSDCATKQCGAAANNVCCGTSCVNLATDSLNCGGCGLACQNGKACSATGAAPPSGRCICAAAGDCPSGSSQTCTSSGNTRCSCNNNNAQCASGETCSSNYCHY
jgi:hypothetical protein